MAHPTQVQVKDPLSGDLKTVYGDVADEYLRQISVHREAECPHRQKERRKKILNDGRSDIKDQCLVCGAPVGSSKSHTEENLASPPWDHTLMTAYAERRTAERNTICREALDAQAVKDAELDQQSSDWQAEYRAYLRTPAWQQKRVKVFERAKGICEGCGEVPATVVHHLTYSHMGDELLFQLVALCRPCHDKAHPEHRDSFYDIDFLPCEQCRWGLSNIDCGKFNVRCYEALSPSGACGPTAQQFEGYK